MTDAQASVPQAPSDNALQTEYSEVCSSFRFFTGARFALLTFATTLLSALITAYQFLAINKTKLGFIGQIAPIAIPLTAAACTLLIVLIEERVRILYGTCIERGKQIETLLHLEEGHFQVLWSSSLPLGISHTRAIRILYSLVIILSMILTIVGIVHYR